MPSQSQSNSQRTDTLFNKLGSRSPIAGSTMLTGKEKERELMMGNSYTDSMLSSNDRRRVLTTMMNEHRGLANDYSG